MWVGLILAHTKCEFCIFFGVGVNHTFSGSKVMAILLKGWILTIGGPAARTAGLFLSFQLAVQVC